MCYTVTHSTRYYIMIMERDSQARSTSERSEEAKQPSLKTTRYFEEQVLRKRPYIRREWCEQTLTHPLRREVQPDGRVRMWAYIRDLGKYLRVVTLDDGETVHNAFPDRDFTE